MNEAKIQQVKQLLDSAEQPPICVAPMAQVNDLAFRMQLRKHGFSLVWTGMMSSCYWASTPENRCTVFTTCEEDRPLICQITGNNTEEMIQMAKDLEPHCDMIDIDLCCSVSLAKRDNVGYYQINTIEGRRNTCEMLKTINESISHPLSIKTRIINDEDGVPSQELTIEFAKELEKAGVALISLHGRSAQIDKFGAVDTELIHNVVQSVDIPVIANGGVTCQSDIEMLFESTGAAGVMIGQQLLINPWLLEKDENNPVEMAREYMQLFEKYPGCSFVSAKRHIYKLFQHWLHHNQVTKEKIENLKDARELNEFIDQYENGEFNQL